jgi:hypothetical protein
VQAARILVCPQEATEDEDIATPDPTSVGLRVVRKVRCVLDADDATEYTVKTAGAATGVQWLMTAAAGTTFLLTVQVRGADGAFNILAHLNTATVGLDLWRRFVNKHTTRTRGSVLKHEAKDTPHKRQKTHDAALPVPRITEFAAFSKRMKLE